MRGKLNRSTSLRTGKTQVQVQELNSHLLFLLQIIDKGKCSSKFELGWEWWSKKPNANQLCSLLADIFVVVA